MGVSFGCENPVSAMGNISDPKRGNWFHSPVVAFCASRFCVAIITSWGMRYFLMAKPDIDEACLVQLALKMPASAANIDCAGLDLSRKAVELQR